MKKIFILAGITISFYSCTRNAVTGRSQLSLVSDSAVQSMALNEYRDFLSKNKVVGTDVSKDAEMVRRVGQRITKAITEYYTGKGQQNILEGYQWEYNLISSNEVNAWCMPGGKIVVYTGLLNVTQNEAALAVVVGHEVTHALAKHGNERMSESIVQNYGQKALSELISTKTPGTQNLFNIAYGITTNYGVMLPFSRRDEYEADQFGLNFAALAGYNPQESISLWERMEKASSGNRPPEFLSTHPSEGNRIERLKKQMPEALKLYKPVK